MELVRPPLALPVRTGLAPLRWAMSGSFGLYVISLATSMSGMEITSGILFFLLGISLVIDRPADFRWELPPLFWPLAVLSAIVVVGIYLGAASAKERGHDLGRLRYFLIYGALYYYLRWYGREPRRWVGTLAVVATVVGIYGVFQHFIPLDLVRPAGKQIIMYSIPDEKLGPLVLGTFNHHLTFANIYLFYGTLFLGLGAVRTDRRVLRWGSTLLGSLLLLLCLWSHSRTAWIAVPVVVLMLLGARGMKWVVGGGAAVLVAAGLSFLQDRGLGERFSRTLFSTYDGFTAAPRLRLWRLQWEMFKEAPWFGIGWNNNERFCGDYFNKFYSDVNYRFCGHAHSIVLQMLSTTGILGLLAFVWIWGALFRMLVVSCRRFASDTFEGALAWSLLVAFVGFIIQGSTQWNFGDAEVLHNVIFFWAVAAALFRGTSRHHSAFVA